MEKKIRWETFVKRFIASSLTALLALLVSWGMGENICASEPSSISSEESADFVLVLDCSGSMNQNDPNGLTRTAAEQFVNMLPNFNARLGIVVFGDHYGTNAYDIGRKDSRSQDRVSIAYPLTPASNDNTQNAITIIDRETAKSGDFSPLGYAFEAAAKMLEEGKASPEKAAIILISDGQIEGQDDGQNDNGYDSSAQTVIKKDYESVDNALAIASSRKWPVYCMELNYAGVNKKGLGYPGVAYYQMREHIPEVMKEVRPKEESTMELQSAEQAEEVFRKIFQNFFPSTKIDFGKGEIKGGKADFSIDLPDMTAELTVQLSGNMQKISRVEILDPDANLKTFTSANSGKVVSGIEVSFKKDYASFKVLSPKEGRWKVSVFGEEKTTFKYQSVAFRETTLFLTASQKTGEVKSGTEIEFTAQYGHGEERYSSKNFYKDHPAQLIVNDESVAMTSTEDGYRVTYSLQKKGTYKIRAIVKSADFRGGEKKSSALSFSVNYEPMYTTGLIPDVTLGVQETSSPIDLRNYFVSDNPINYEIVYDSATRSAGIQDSVTPDGKLQLVGARKKGVYEITVQADDSSGFPPVTQNFKVIVENKPLNLVSSGGKKEVRLVYDANDGGQSYRINWEEFFHDPDPVQPYISAAGLENSGIDMVLDETGAVFTATKSASKDIQITAIDASDLTILESFPLHITAVSAFDDSFGKFKIPAIIGLIVLVAALAVILYNFLGKKIYGSWNISLDNGDATENPVVLSKQSACRKSSCRLSKIVSSQMMEGDFGRAELRAGGKLGKNVFLVNYDGAEELSVNNNSKDTTKKEKISIPPRTVVYLRMPTGDGITLERVSK